MKTRKSSRRTSTTNRRSFFESLWNVQPQKRARRSLKVEQLEDRRVMAVLYVDNPADYSITTDQGAGGLDNGDTVTWNAGAGTEHAPASVGALTFGTNAFSTIQAAVTAATPGDTIRVAGGTFSELVNLNKQLFLFGNQVGDDARDGRAGDPETIVNAAGLGGAFSISSSDVVIDGFAIQGQTGGFPGAAIWMQPGTAGTEVRNNIIQNNVVGIFVSNNSAANQTVIERNLFQNNTNPGSASGHDIYADEFTAGAGMQNILIDSNTFTNTSLEVNSWSLGISNTGAAPFTNITYSNNVVTNHGRGLYFFNTDGATISGNEITGASNYAIGIFTAFGTDNNANIDILNNKLSNNNRGVWVDGYAGILDVNDNDLSGNATAGIQNDDADATIDAEYNWWGSPTGPTSPNNPGGTGSPITGTNAAGVDFSPYFTTGTDTQPGTPGFQGDFTNVANTGPAVIFGTNGDDEITIIARDASTHAGADGVRDFTVSVNGGAEILYLNVATIDVFALSGNDKIVVLITAAIWDVDVNIDGGAPNASDQVEVGTAGTDTVIYTPTGLGTGTLEITNLATTVNLTAGIEHLVYDGLGGGDSLTVDTPAIDGTQVLTPSTAFDEGLLEFQNNTLSGFIATPLKFEGLGTGGSLTLLDSFGGGGRFDNLNYRGTDLDDTFGVNATGQVALNNRILVNTPSIITLTLAGLDGDDTFNIVGNHNLPAISVEGGNPSASDVLNFNGTGGGVAVDFAANAVTEVSPVSFSGVEHLNVNGVEGAADAFTVVNYGAPTGVKFLTLNAGDVGGADEADRIDINTVPLGNDTLRYTPMTRFTSTLTRAEGGPQINIAGFRGHNDTSPLSIAGGQGGEDRMEVYGQNSPTLFTASRFSASNTLVEFTLSAGTGSDEPGIPIDFANFESLVVNGGVGNDTLNVPQGAGGLIDLAGGVTFHGQSGIDRLNLTGATAVTATYTVGPNPDEGSITHVAGAVTQRVNFTGLEPVVDAVPGTLTINATNGNNAINYTQGSVAANGLVSIDSFETYEFTAKTALTINALHGNDTINLNNPTTPTGLTGITVNGGDPTVSDTLIVNGVAATVVVDVTAQTVTGAGAPINYATIEHLTVVAGASTTLSVAGSSATEGVDYTLTPGATDDRGDIETIGVPVSFVGFGAGSTLNFVGDALDGNDELTVLGTNQNDSFSVAGVTGTVSNTGRATLTQTGIDELVIDGLNGDDQFTVASNHPYLSVAIHGNDPSASDVLDFIGTGGLVTVSLVASTITETGFNPVSFSGAERLNVNAGGGDAVVVGGPDDDEFVVTPDVSAVEVVQAGVNTLVRINNVDEFDVDGAAGNNELTVVGTNAADAIEVNVDEVAITGRQTVDYANFALLRVDSRGGSDTITVDINGTAPVAVPLSIEGGLGLDHLVVAGTPTVLVDEVIYQVGPSPERGRLTYEDAANATLMSIEFSGFEPVHDYIPADLTVLGNNANNAINYGVGPNSLVANPQNPGGVETGLISVDAFETIEFGNKIDVTIDGQAGDDDVNVADASNPGASGALTIVGDGPVSGDDVQLNGTLGADTVSIEITGPDSAIVTINGVVTNIETTGGLSFDGLGGDDDLTVLGIAAGDNQFVFTPGANPDAGLITGIDTFGTSESFLPVEFVNLGVNGTLTFDGNSAFDANTLTILATSGHDTADVDTTGDIELTTPSAGDFITISTIEIDDLVFEMLEGDDIVTVAGNHPYDTIAVEGGDPSASDILNFLAVAAGGLVTLEYDAETVTQGANGPVSFAGVELVNIDAASNSVDINGTVDDDAFTVRPNDPTGALVERAGSNARVQVNNTLDLEIDGDDGLGLENSLTIVGTAGDDLITLTASQIAVGGRLPIQYADIQALEVQGEDGEDTLTVNVSGGFPTDGAGAPIPIFYDGGQGFDDLVISGVPTQPVDEVIYGPGPLANTGRVRYEDAGDATLMVVDFLDLEPVLDLVPAATLTVNGTNADNAINYSLAAGGNGLVSVDGFETVEFSNKTILNLNGLAGSDVINIGALGTPTGLATVNVDGGGPTESDRLVVNGMFGGSTIDFAPTAADAGSVSVSALPITNYIRTEAVTYVGRSGGDNLTVTSPAGGAEITFAPGATSDSGVVTQLGFAAASSLTPFEFRDLGLLSTLTFATTGGLRSSGLDIQGTNNDDEFNVNSLGDVQIVKANLPAPVTPSIRTPGVTVLRLLGLNGDDIFNVPGVHPITLGIFVEGGDPSASDVLNFTGSGAGAVVADLTAHTITEGANPPVGFTGVEIVNLDAAGANVLVNGSADVDNVTISPTGDEDLTFVWEGHNTVWNVSGIDDFDFDGLGNDDELRIVYTSAAETIDVDGPAGNVDDGTLQDIDFTNFESLEVFGEEGNDTFNVTPAVGLPIFIDGGDPIGATAGDRIVLVGGGPSIFEPGPESDEGGFRFDAEARVSFDHIEAVTIVDADCPIILGTNGDDDITVIARDVTFDALADGVRDFTVSVNDGLEILYINVTGAVAGIGDLFIDALAGDDDIVIRAPVAGIDWSMNVSVAGGPPSAGASPDGDRLVLETPGANTVIYTPTGSDSGTVLIDENANGTFEVGDTQILIGSFVDACPPINYDSSPGGVELFEYDGEGGNDLFTIVGTLLADTITHTPGGANDEGTFRVNSLLGVSYQNLGTAATLTVDGDDGADNLIVRGTDTNDVFGVTAAGVVSLNARLALNTTDVQVLTLEGLLGDDTFNISGGHPYASINANGGSPSASDVLNFTGTGGLVTLEYDSQTVAEAAFGPVAFTGIEHVNINAVGAPVDINGTLDDDAFTVRPNDATGARIELADHNTTVQVNNTLDLEIDGDNGLGFENSLTVVGTNGDDAITLDANQIAVAGRLPVRYSDIQALRLEGSAGSDVLTVDVTAGFPTNGANNPIPITYDGGDGFDSLVISGVPTQPVDEVIYGPGPLADQGRVRYENVTNLPLMVIDFNALEPVIDLVLAATLTVNGTNASNAINYGQDPADATRGLVSVDGFETIAFNNKTNLVINGLAGDDTVNVTVAPAPTGLTGIEVNGNDPGASDTLIITGTTGSDAFEYAPGAVDGGEVLVTGSPTVSFNTISALTIDGRSDLTDDTLAVRTEAGFDVVTLTPGANFDSGTVDISALAGTESRPRLSFQGIGQDATLTFLSGGLGAREDLLIYLGTEASDTFAVLATGQVQLNAQVSVLADGAASLMLLGLDGDDTFNIAGGHPFASGILVDAGNPSASDIVNFSGSAAVANLITVDLAASTVTEAGFGAVTLSGVELLNVLAATHDVRMAGTPGHDVLSVTPTGPNEVTAELLSSNPSIGATPVVNATAAGVLTVDLVTGSDRLIVNGTQNGETIVVTGALVTVAALETVNYLNADDLQVNGQSGDDTFNVTPAATTTIFIDGGDPIGSSPGDLLNLLPPAAFQIEPGPENDEGGLTGTGIQRVSWDHIESVTVSGPGPGKVLGTGADDDITIIARDASTHPALALLTPGVQDFTVTVNDGPEILFINVPVLFVDADAGDDDIVLRAPAPNGAVWDVDVNIAGGPPAAATGSQGDVFEYETPGTQTIVYTPTGIGTATLNDTTNSALITIAGFICPVSGLPSSPGGVEQVVYQGLNGGDTLTANGTALDDSFVYNPANGGTGSHTSNAAPAFSFSGVTLLNVNGGAGLLGDNLIVNGTQGPDVVTSPAVDSILLGGGRVNIGAGMDLATLNTFDGNDTITLDLDLDGLKKVVDAGAGDDNVNLSASDDADIFGGIGNDTLIGTPLADNIFGGFGNDILIGGGGVDHEYGEEGNDIFQDLLAGGIPSGAADDGGADFLFGGDGSDVFVWEPGDGNDTIEGGSDESDRIIFQGNAAATAFTFNSGNGNVGGTRLEFLFGAVDLDVAGVEDFDLNTLGGGDTVTVNDLTQTDLRFIDIDLFTAVGDADSVIVNGRSVSDEVDIAPLPAPNAAIVAITGLAYDIRVSGATAVAGAGGDLLTFNANNGNDTVVSSDLLAALYAPEDVIVNGGAGDDFLTGFGTLNGGLGDDTLIGGALVNLINGGDGDDQIFGGAGLDTINGDAGEDVIVPGFDGADDIVSGGADFDTILVQGSSANDRIDAIQDSVTQVRYVITTIATAGLDLNDPTGAGDPAANEIDALPNSDVEELRIVAGSGDDRIRVTHHDSLIVGGDELLSLRFSVDGGAPGASDRLTVTDHDLGDTTIHRVGGIAGNGSYTIGALAPVDYTDIEFASLNNDPVDGFADLVNGFYGSDGEGRLFVFKHDPFEENNDRLNATFLGSNSAINVDPVIDPGPDAGFGIPGDQDWYRVVAQFTGDLDLRVFFRHQVDLANGRAGLPGDGDLDITLFDAEGNILATSTSVDNDERIRIPAVEGQTYYLSVFGFNGGINVYNVSAINTPAPIPFDLELDDIVGVAAVNAGATATTFSATAVPSFTLSTVDDFYNGKDIVFTNAASPLNGIRGRVVDYVGLTQTFVFAAGTFFTAPIAGDTFQIESPDTGRSQFDNITRDTTPTIFIRVPDSALLNDVPDNGGAPGLPPDQVIPILHVPDLNTDVPNAPAVGPRSGFRVAVFVTETSTHTPVLAGYAQPVVGSPGVYSYTFDTPLLPNDPGISNTRSFFISSRVEMIDPASLVNGADLDEQAQGFGAFAESLEIVVDTQVPPVFFGLPNDLDDGLHPDSDTGINANPETLNDGVTSDTTPTFFGQAEADAVIRLFIDAPEPGFPTGDGVFNPSIDFQIGFDVAEPFDGTNQYPAGYWEATSNVDLNALPFDPIDGLRRIFVTAEDVAGNIGPAQLEVLEIFLDTQGPQVTGVFINSAAEFLGITGATAATDALIRFRSDNPGAILSTTNVTLPDAGFVLRAIDILPGTTGAGAFGPFNQGTLFGLGTNGAGLARVYAIVPGTGVGTGIGGTFAVAAGATGFGFDFNPTNNLLRITNDADQNFSFDVTTGVATAQAALNPANPSIVGSAYDRNDTDPASLTTLYGIDFAADTLVRQGSPNGVPNAPGTGILTTVGPLGVDTIAIVGFDIATGTNSAYGALGVGGFSSLYTVNLATGQASEIGLIGAGAPVTGLTVLPAYDLFDPKPSTDGPTPLVNSLVITFQDLPERTLAFLIDALKPDVADSPGLYQVIGDYNGIMPIIDIIVTNVPPVVGQPALATVELVFRQAGADGIFNTVDDIGSPLPDDRFSLIISDSIIDYAGNQLDGESNASEPQEFPTFPSGDGINGGNFFARFTVDTRPEVGVWAGGSAWIDTNGNTSFDPTNPDFTNRDITYVLGYTADELFAGKFVAVNDPSNRNTGFDKLAAYGRLGNSTFRWLVDTDNDGVPDIEHFDPANINGYPVAGNFDQDFAGDEVGIFAGNRWHFDTDHNFEVDSQLAWSQPGTPIVGDFDGDGLDDLGTWRDDTFFIDLSSVGAGGTALPGNPGVNGTIDRTFKFGFVGVSEKAVAADMNMDGIEDLGLWVPARDGVPPTEGAEWYFLISGAVQNDTPGPGGAPPSPGVHGPSITGGVYPSNGHNGPGEHLSVANYGAFGLNATSYLNGRIVDDPLVAGPGDVVRFNPTPFGKDQYFQFGDGFSLPIVGNFDPPVAGSAGLGGTGTNPRNVLDVNNDGAVTAADALFIIDHLNVVGAAPVPTSGFIGSPFLDVDRNNYVSPADAIMVIDYLNINGGEGEAADAYFSELAEGEGESDSDDLLALLAMDAASQNKKK